MAEISKQHNRQELRLLYVGWTRARDRLILAGREPEFQKGILAMLQDKEGNWLLSCPDGEQATWAGRTFDIKTRELEPAEPEERTVAPGKDYPEVQPREYPPASLAASDMPGDGEAASLERIASRLGLEGDPDMNLLGEAVHTFYAADRSSFDWQHRLQLAGDILGRWACGAFLTSKQLVQSADSLYAWIQGKYPQAVWKREYPVMYRLEAGTQVHGFIDLLLETPNELVIIDHKVFPGSMEDIRIKSREYVGQLEAYQNCLKKLSSLPTIRYLHYPVGGWMVVV